MILGHGDHGYVMKLGHGDHGYVMILGHKASTVQVNFYLPVSKTKTNLFI